MTINTVRLTMAQAFVRYLCAQYTEIDGDCEPLFAGVFGIFGHGNVTCFAEALERVQDQLPTWRGQNEQSQYPLPFQQFSAPKQHLLDS